jgi:Lar family restriction alleviation protein
MIKIRVIYSDGGKSGIDIDKDFDKQIQELFEGLGFNWTGQGYDLEKSERDICFENAEKHLCREPESPSTEELKSCPFCGSEDVSISTTHYQKIGDVAGYHGECHECASCGPDSESKEDAVRAWNTRKE